MTFILAFAAGEGIECGLAQGGGGLLHRELSGAGAGALKVGAYDTIYIYICSSVGVLSHVKMFYVCSGSC
jgi:hypothetical protein